MQKKRIRDYGVTIGRLKPGARNKITDVTGVKVGHVTIRNEIRRTGVTVIVPGPDNAFTNKYTAACYVHNGFGKSAGLVQIEELGTLETPIALTNTLNVGLVWAGLGRDRSVYDRPLQGGRREGDQFKSRGGRAMTAGSAISPRGRCPRRTYWRRSPGRTRNLRRATWARELVRSVTV